VDNVEAKPIGKQILAALKEKDLSGLAQQIAYNILFSLAPLLIFVTAAAGAVTQVVNDELDNPAAPVLQWMQETLPADAADFLAEPMENALSTDPGFLLSFGAILALWGAKNAMSAIIKGLNKTYDVEEDSRSFIVQNLVAIGLTIGMALMIGVAGLVFVLGTGLGQDIADGIGLGSVWTTVSEWLRWPLIALVVIAAVTLIHYYGPNIDAPIKWFVPGAAFTVISMAIATALVGLYFSVSGGYSKAYGAFGSVLAFIFWLYVMSLLILLGGVINMAVQKEVPPARRDVEVEDDTKNDNEDLLAQERYGS
jgi:membrane protein